MGLFSSKSSSSTSQTSNNYDQKNQVAEGGVGISGVSGGSQVSVMTTDYGTVSKAFDFAAMLASGAASESAASQAAVQQTATSAMQSVQSAYKGVNENLAAAYEGAKAGEQKIMVAGALALLALVAIKMYGGRA